MAEMVAAMLIDATVGCLLVIHRPATFGLRPRPAFKRDLPYRFLGTDTTASEAMQWFNQGYNRGSSAASVTATWGYPSGNTVTYTF
jgi:hypothetical protein